MTEIGLGSVCNNACMMCTNIVPNNSNLPGKDYLFNIIDNAKDDEFIVTGGEPTIYPHLMDILDQIQTKHPKAHITLITNARLCMYPDFVNQLSKIKNLKVITEIHGPDSETHDAITNARGSFDQTMQGIKNLLKNDIEVELRFVIHRLNYDKLHKTVNLSAATFAPLKYVFFPIDIIGNAYVNREDTVISLTDMTPHLQKAIDYLIKIDYPEELISVYHVPFCKLDSHYWQYVVDDTVPCARVDYPPLCNKCQLKSQCPGLWKTYAKIVGMKELHPIKKDTNYADKNLISFVKGLDVNTVNQTDYEVISLCLGLKKVVRGICDRSEIPKIKSKYQRLGLHILFSDYILPDDLDADVKDTSPFADYKSMFYISKVISTNASAQEMERDIYSRDEKDKHKQLGLLLGYPRCCVDNYLQYIDKAAYNEISRNNGDGINPLLDNKDPKKSLVSHAPCSPHCAETINNAQKLFDFINCFNPQVARFIKTKESEKITQKKRYS